MLFRSYIVHACGVNRGHIKLFTGVLGIGYLHNIKMNILKYFNVYCLTFSSLMNHFYETQIRALNTDKQTGIVD